MRRILLASSHHFHRAVRERLQKAFAVTLTQYPIVQNNDDSFIGLGPDQAADTLSQFQDCFWKRIFRERIAAVGLNIFELGLNQRMIGNGERESGDDNVRKSFSGDIDPGPETVGPEQNAVCRTF